MMKGRWAVMLATVLVLITGAATPAGASGPYDSATATHSVDRDVLGLGDAHAAATADKTTGLLTTSTDAVEFSPVQYFSVATAGIGVNASAGNASAKVTHALTLSQPGAYDITVAFRSVTVNTASNANGYSTADAFVDATCAATCDGTQYRYIWLSCFQCAPPAAFNVTENIVVHEPTTVTITAGIDNRSDAQGNATAAVNGASSAKTDARATIDSITATFVS